MNTAPLKLIRIPTLSCSMFNQTFGSRSPMVASPSRDLAHFAGLEDKFCKDFACCGVTLENLHDLLQHFEECHVRVESDVEDDEDLPFEFESMDEMDTDMSDGDSPSSAPVTFTDIFLKSQLQSLPSQPQAVALADIYSEDYRITNKLGSASSAFHTSVIQRKRLQTNPASTRVRKVKPVNTQDLQTNGNGTIPFSFDGPTQVAADVEMEDAIPSSPVTISHAMPSPPMSLLPQQQPQHQLPQQQFLQQQHSPLQQMQQLGNQASQNIPTITTTSPTLDPSSPAMPMPSAFDLAIAAANAQMGLDASLMIDDGSRDDRPYKCKIMGCTKAYKNPGGLKYHMQHGHCEDTGDPEMNNIIHKPYQCTVPDCGKRYKNLNGLKVCLLFDYNASVNNLTKCFHFDSITLNTLTSLSSVHAKSYSRSTTLSTTPTHPFPPHTTYLQTCLAYFSDIFIFFRSPHTPSLAFYHFFSLFWRGATTYRGFCLLFSFFQKLSNINNIKQAQN